MIYYLYNTLCILSELKKCMIFLSYTCKIIFWQDNVFDIMLSTIRKWNEMIEISRLSASYMDKRNHVGCIWEL